MDSKVEKCVVNTATIDNNSIKNGGSAAADVVVAAAANNIDGDKWGMPLKTLYRLGLGFFKDKSGKAVHLSYEDNLKLIAFTQQASHGPMSAANAQPLGVLDVIGRDRRIAWQQLGTITKAQSMEGFIDLLDRLCASFKPYVEAIKKADEERQRVADEQQRRQQEQQEAERARHVEQAKVEEAKNREEQQKRQLQDALNQQTFHQFKEYAEKQFPGNPEQQALLIRQLQNEHYHQYMQQLQAQLVINSTGGSGGAIKGATPIIDSAPTVNEKRSEDDATTTRVHQNLEVHADATEYCTLDNCQEAVGGGVNIDSDNDSSGAEFPLVNPASMWTRPDIQFFKQEVSAGKGDGVIRVGHGDTVTVRVPTHDGGSCLFWEFCTDTYDVGFGVYFEWGKPLTTEVSVHISESDDDDDGPEDDDYGDGLYT